ncbi:MAG: sigma-70 family RNA polymerase sigma factor [Planctomycetes bacterium]|nr:sigma-70 family RNA polymerase sigma factor [Planctomycetota bacterium]
MRTDLELFEAYRGHGDRQALDELFRRHVDAVYRTTRRILGNNADAEDATQAAFMNVIRHAATLKEGASFAGWLYRIAVNAALKARARRAQERPVAGLEAVVGSNARREGDMRQVLEKAIEGLPEEYRHPIQLHYFEGLTCDEIAEALECPRGTVGTRLNRGMDRLRAALAGSGLALTAAALLAAGQEAKAEMAPKALVEAIAGAIRKAPVVAAAAKAAGGWLLAAGKAMIVMAVLTAIVGTIVRLRPERTVPVPPAEGTTSGAAPRETLAAVSDTEVEQAKANAALESEPTWGITGRVVTSAGQPLAGAQVWATDLMIEGVDDPSVLPDEVCVQTPPPEPEPLVREVLGSMRKRVATDADGHYRMVPGVHFDTDDRMLRIRAYHSETASGFVVLKGIQAGEYLIAPEIRLPAGVTLVGQVTDTEGRPLAGIPVNIMRSPTGLAAMVSMDMLPCMPAVTQTNAAGRFLIERVPSGAILVGVGGRGYVFSSKKIEVAEGGVSDEIAFRLKKGRTLTGQVVMSDGTPVKTGLFLGLGTGIVTRQSLTGNSDAEGRFVFDGLPFEAGRILVMKGGRMVQENFDAEQTSIKIVLKRPGALLGEVIDRATGMRIEHFTVVGDAKKGVPDAIGRVRGEKGAFRFETSILTPEGTYYLSVRADGYATAWFGPYDLKDDQETNVGTFTLDPGHSVRGVCLNERGDPVSGACVAAVPPGTKLDAGLTTQFFYSDQARTGTDGGFAIDDLAPGIYDLFVAHALHPPQRFDAMVTNASPVRIVLKPGGAIRGKIKKEKGRTFVKITSAEGWDYQEKLADDGSYRFGPLAPGTYHVRVTIETGFLSSRTLAEAHVAVSAGGEAVWDGESAPPVEVTVRATVFTAQGEPAVGYHVMLIMGDKSLENVHMATTDGQGAFEIANVRPARYYVVAAPSLDEDADPYQSVEITGAEPLSIQLPLQESSAEGLLTDASGRPLAGTNLRVRYADDKNLAMVYAQTATQSDGRFILQRLSASAFDLYLPGEGVSQDRLLRTFRVDERQTLDLGTVRVP